jgi:hypothetical protein
MPRKPAQPKGDATGKAKDTTRRVRIPTGVGNRGKGRKKGSLNKTTAALKDAILNAFAKVNGEDYLVMVAKSDPRTFCSLLGRVLPLTLEGDAEKPIRIEVAWAP